MATEGDRELEDLFASYVDRLNAGEELDAQKILAENPIHGAEILDHIADYVAVAGAGDAVPAASVALGTLGDYTLRRQIGRGGMGLVYEAWEGSMDRPVALKVLPAAVAADTRTVTRFVREAQIAGKLSHPNVVSVYAVGVKGAVPYYAMELVEGETLARIVARMRGASPDSPTPFGAGREELAFYSNLARAFADVADGLQHAHSRGVVHRDIKPSNLILDAGAGSGRRRGNGGNVTDPVSSAEGAFAARLRILDFGLARLEGQESLSASGDVVGTPLYMSPEQARRRKVPVDHRTDVYSLGATLYEVLTLEPPFRGRDHEDTLSQIIAREPRPPRQLNPRVPRDLETIVLKCLRKEPGDRYGTAEALGQDLRRFVRGDPIEARAQTRWERLAYQVWGRRRPLLAAAAAGLLCLVGLGVSTVVVSGAYRTVRDERDARMRDLYVSDMRLAMEMWESGNILPFENILVRHVPDGSGHDLRGWEWRYLTALRHVARRTIDVDREGAHAVTWSPDGRHIAVGGADGFVSIWPASRGEAILRLAVSEAPVRAVSWSPDGTSVAAAAQDGTLRGWRISSAEEFLHEAPRLPPEEQPTGRETRTLAWSPDGSLLATAPGEAQVDIRDGRDGRILQRLPAEEADCVPCLAWSGDGSRLAACFRGPPHGVIWETAGWSEVRRFAVPGGFLYGISWSPDARRLATGSANGPVLLWNVDALETPGEPVQEHAGHVFSLSWSSTADRLASTGTDAVIRVSRIEGSRGHVKVLLGHRDIIWQVTWSPDGRALASASQDGTVKTWDPDVSRAGPDFPRELAGAWSADGRWLASYAQTDGVLLVRDADTLEVLASIPHESPITSTSFHPRGALLAAALQVDTVSIIDWGFGREVARIAGRHGDRVDCAAWSPDGRWLASGGADGRLRLWDGAKFDLVHELPAHTERIGAVAWSPDGTRLATTGIDLGLKIWETTTWRVLHDLVRGRRAWKAGYSTQPHALAWSPDGTRLAAGAVLTPEQRLVVFDARDGSVRHSGAAHISGVASVAWSPDGRRLATGGFDRLVRIWDTERFEELLTLRGHEGKVDVLRWHPSGRRLLSAEWLGGLKIWDAERGYEESGSHACLSVPRRPDARGALR